jgi:hypothetical protein
LGHHVQTDSIQVNDFVTQQDIWQTVGTSAVDRTFVLRSYLTERVYTIKVPANGEVNAINLPDIPIRLDHFQFDIYSISLLEGGIAILGLINKFNSLAGILHADHTTEGYSILLKCCGTLGIFVEGPEDTKLSIKLDQLSSVNESWAKPVKLGRATGHAEGSIIGVEIEETVASLAVNLAI